MFDEALGVEGVEDGVGVALVAGSEDEDVEVATQVADDLSGVGTDVDVAGDDLALDGLEGHLQLPPLHHGLVGVDQRLVHVKYDRLPA